MLAWARKLLRDAGWQSETGRPVRAIPPQRGKVADTVSLPWRCGTIVEKNFRLAAMGLLGLVGLALGASEWSDSGYCRNHVLCAAHSC